MFKTILAWATAHPLIAGLIPLAYVSLWLTLAIQVNAVFILVIPGTALYGLGYGLLVSKPWEY